MTITIIGILASMLLGASSLAMNTARVSRTESLVTRLHTLVSQHYDSFRHRRVEVRELSGGAKRQVGYRLEATYEQLRLELPDRWTDITLAEIKDPPIVVNSPAGTPLIRLEERPPMSRMYLRRYNRLAAAGVSREDLVKNQGAECLYMIVMLACGDGESAGLFKESDIGDTDGDGAPEFIDSWGNPIEFLRWAPGFDSDVQLNAAKLQQIASKPAEYMQVNFPNASQNASPENAVRLAISADHDPFDVFRVSTYADGDPPRGYRLVPLIYSAGPNQEYGIASPNPDDKIGVKDDLTYQPTANPLDPYAPVDHDSSSSTDAVYLGQALDRAAATDNIHNHLITGR
ncbi:hypothetical protein Pla123a_37730 [Posidoniimonas polymericola]|uniref:Uncharacterized protein n=1 Tax=Posidoniimonas polymericola TaxID=2528002 RepID=A0A5C5YEL8_9BACT|nr:hypothetical protein Pla123a_37730 [Posidoniimonas polymericola]